MLRVGVEFGAGDDPVLHFLGAHHGERRAGAALFVAPQQQDRQFAELAEFGADQAL
jgi:hypothetical protein